MSELLNKILNTISIVIECEQNELSINFDMKNTDKWDSLNHVVVILKICDVFALEFKKEFILEFTSVRKIYNFIKLREDK